MTSSDLSQSERPALAALRRPRTNPIRIEGNTIVDGIVETLQHFRGLLLDIGCGTMPYADLVRGRIDRHIGVELTLFISQIVYTRRLAYRRLYLRRLIRPPDWPLPRWPCC